MNTMRLLFTFLCVFLSVYVVKGQTIPGCTIPCAPNYSPAATVNDCSCILPDEPATECWETATLNPETCEWEVTGDQPEEPMMDCWPISIFDEDDCKWILTGGPEFPEFECWQYGILNNALCEYEIMGNPPEEPNVECWETTTFDEDECEWIVTGEQPEEPETECNQYVVFNDSMCQWEIFDVNLDDDCDFTIDSLDTTTCTVIHTPNCPVGTLLDIENCECTSEPILGCTESCATNYNPYASTDDGSCIWPEEPISECWQTATFNDTTCEWEITGTQPEEPDSDCFCWVSFNTTTCAWDNWTCAEFPEPNLECYQYAIFDFELCEWEIFDISLDDGCDLTDDFFYECTCEFVHIHNCPIGMLFDAENCECVVYGGIQNFTFYDENQNQIQDNGEPFMSIPLMLNSNNLSIYTNNENLYILEPGNYTVSIDTGTEWMLTTDSTSYSITVNVNDTIPVHFGLYPSALNSDVQTTVYALWPRCNELYTIDVSTKNIGTTLASGTTWFQMDTAIVDFTFIHEPDVVDNNTFPTSYGWNFTNLYPSETATWQVEILVPGPPDFAVGDLLLLESLTEYTDVNGTHIEQGITCGGEVRCSYDPNDKLVNPSRPYDEVLFGEDFIYTIRFQNTGNDVAYDVTIRDTLDTNLDWETFRVLGSSHSEVLNTSLDNEGILTFDFPNIFLPDSTSNLEGSNGHVTYMISALDGLAENTVINNSAGIYFDQNPPIITNTTESVMVSMLTSTTTPKDLFPDLTILPNPNTGTFQVEGIPRGTYNLLNTKGQIIQSGQLESGTLIDISAAAQGVYFIQMMVDEQMVTRRVVKL